MKKIILLFFFFITLGCALTSTVMKSDKIKIGTNQVDFCNKFGLFTGGPCASTFMDGYNNVVKGVYYPETGKEIMHDADKKYFFVFDSNLTGGFNYNTLNASYKNELIGVFTDFEMAKDFAGGKKFGMTGQEVDFQIKNCEKQGFKKGTMEHLDCALGNM